MSISSLLSAFVLLSLLLAQNASAWRNLGLAVDDTLLARASLNVRSHVEVFCEGVMADIDSMGNSGFRLRRAQQLKQLLLDGIRLCGEGMALAPTIALALVPLIFEVCAAIARSASRFEISISQYVVVLLLLLYPSRLRPLTFLALSEAQARFLSAALLSLAHSVY